MRHKKRTLTAYAMEHAELVLLYAKKGRVTPACLSELAITPHGRQPLLDISFHNHEYYTGKPAAAQ